MIRYGYPLFGLPYCADENTGLVHDLNQEQEDCRIAHAISSNRARPFYSLEAAHEKGFSDCPQCLPADRPAVT